MPARLPDAVENEVGVFAVGVGVAGGEKFQWRRGQRPLGFGIGSARGVEIAPMSLGNGKAV